jgi:GntR family transcriptional regulator/MocR family aminotransferase
MHLELDGTGPRHAQLTRALKAAMLAGRLAAGERLPATRLLAAELALARNTVLAAYEQLRAEGFVDARVGSGTYVRELGLQVPAAPVPRVRTATAAPSRYVQRLRALPPRPPVRREPGIRYDLQVGEPVTDPRLASAWRRALARAALYTPPGYPPAQGLPALREAVCATLARRRGLRCTPDELLIVGGTQQAFAIAARVLLDEGDVAGLEDPHYFGARYALQSHGAEIAWLPVDREGLVTAALARRSPKLVCVTPSHQFPSGVVMSLRRRVELLQHAERHAAWILEDDYDGEFRCDARPLPALRAMDSQDRVIYVGSFSKMLFPGLRLAYMVLPAALRDDFLLAKRWSDFGCPAIEQAALAGFMADGGFERHLRRAAKTLRARRASFLRALQKHAAPHLQLDDSGAGMHLVGWLPALTPADCEQLVDLARERGLGLLPISRCFARQPPVPGLLLGYAGLSPAQLNAAARLLGDCLSAVAGPTRSAGTPPGPSSPARSASRRARG